MADKNTQDSDNYIRKYAKNILTYESYAKQVRISKPVPEDLSPEEILAHYASELGQPSIPEDAGKVLDRLKRLVNENENYEWPEIVTKYVQSIFPPVIIQPFSGGIADYHSALTALDVARWMGRLGYMFSKHPEVWREWELLVSRPYHIHEIKVSLARLQSEHGEYLHEFCDEDGSLRAPSYNEMILFLGRISMETDEWIRRTRRLALEGVLAFFQENSVFKLNFDGHNVREWELDFFRFERPDLVEGVRVSGSFGTVRVVMPARCADVGLKNHFPHEAYKVVSEQVSPLSGVNKSPRRTVGLSDSQLMGLINAVVQETKSSGQMFNTEVMELLQRRSVSLYGEEATPSATAFSQARFFRDRLGKISKDIGHEDKIVDSFNSWLCDLKSRKT